MDGVRVAAVARASTASDWMGDRRSDGGVVRGISRSLAASSTGQYATTAKKVALFVEAGKKAPEPVSARVSQGELKFGHALKPINYCKS